MQKELCALLSRKLVGLPFVQVLAGMAQTVTREDPDENNEVKIQRRFPVATDHNLGTDGEYSPERILIPDSNRACIIYFEDYGITMASRGRNFAFTSSIRLVCWCNREKLVMGDPLTGHVVGRMQTGIIARLTGNPFNEGMFSRILVNVEKIPPQDAGIFGRYTYSETDRQYLRPPFDFFAIDFSVKFETPCS